MHIEEELLLKNINPKTYLQAVKVKAMYYNYDWRSIKFADDNKHKLEIRRPDGKFIKFGASDYNDFIIYSIMAKKHKISYDDAIKHRDNFHKRMKRKNDDLYTPLNLSLNLLW